jgi:hypothetical protein
MKVKVTSSTVLVLSFTLLLLTPSVGLAETVDFNFTSPVVVTSAVPLSGIRQEKSVDYPFDSGPGRVFDQASFSAKVVHEKNADDALCTPIFSNYVDYIPGIKTPTRVVLHSYVRSVGGVFNGGLFNARKTGEVACFLSGKYLDVVSVNGRGSGVDTQTVIPTVPVYLLLERQDRSLVTASVPLSVLEYMIGGRVNLKDANWLNTLGRMGAFGDRRASLARRKRKVPRPSQAIKR